MTYGKFKMNGDTLLLFPEYGQFVDSLSLDSWHITGDGEIRLVLKDNNLIPIYAQYEYQSNFDPNYKYSFVYNFINYGNPRFNFWYDYPEDWDITDISMNGDGYQIIPKDSVKADIRIYGRNIINKDETKQGEIFEYYDKKIGRIIYKDNEIRIIRSLKDSEIVLVVKSSKDWLDKNSSLIKAIGMSIREGKRIQQ